MSTHTEAHAGLAEAWTAAWPQALEAWSRYTRLRPPSLCLRSTEAVALGLTGSFAMIRLSDQNVVIDLEQVRADGLEDLAVEVLAHEIGHHVYAPGTLDDHVRTLARVRHALPGLAVHAPLIANLYTDLLINDRLQRQSGLRMAEVYRRLAQRSKGPNGALWSVYLRIYEVLWSLPRRSLGGDAVDDAQEGDAWLGARVIRSYARDWLRGAGRFAALLYPYLEQASEGGQALSRLMDTRSAGEGGEPAGGVEIDPEELEDAIHPADDPALNGKDDAAPRETPPTPGTASGARGQARDPFTFGELLRAAGLKLTPREAAIRYYAERARPHLVRFPVRRAPQATEPLPEGLEPWALGEPFEELAWFESLVSSPIVIPGLTTLKRIHGDSPGRMPQNLPVDLDLYVDSSGSMPDPAISISYPALAGAIIALSALRVGARVQCVLWSGRHDVLKTDGFVGDTRAILAVLTGHFGGGTQFPLPTLRETYAHRAPSARPVHVLIISDDGVSTLYDKDERGREGYEVAGEALARAGGGGTMVLNISQGWESYQPHIVRARDEQGWAVHAVSSMEDLVAFARAFSKAKYATE
ncbi:MAG: VWA domain-containing protein [Bradymonadia bacterium]